MLKLSTPSKPRPTARPKSVNYQNSRKPCAPGPPPLSQETTIDQSNKPINIPSKKKHLQHSLSHLDVENFSEEDPAYQKSSKSQNNKSLTKSTSIGEIKQHSVRHSFRMVPPDSSEINSLTKIVKFNQAMFSSTNGDMVLAAKSIPLPKAYQVMKEPENGQQKQKLEEFNLPVSLKVECKRPKLNVDIFEYTFNIFELEVI